MLQMMVYVIWKVDLVRYLIYRPTPTGKAWKVGAISDGVPISAHALDDS